MNETLLTKQEVCKLLKIGHSSLYDLINKCGLPAPYKLGTRRARWKLSEIQEYINSLSKAELKEIEELSSEDD